MKARMVLPLTVLLLSALPAVAQKTAAAPAVTPVPNASPADIAALSAALNITPANSTPPDAGPPTLRLVPHGPNAHPASVWLRSAPDGLHLFGDVTVDQGDLRLPYQKAGVLGSDHLEVWLATAPGVAMPDIGWRNQFGDTLLKRPADCADDTNAATPPDADCVRWYDLQLQYRQQLRRLFVRQWLITQVAPYGPAQVFEDYANTAYGALRSMVFPNALPALLAPDGNDGVTAQYGARSRMEQRLDAAGHDYPQAHAIGYTFHIVIPYTAFPPARQFRLEDLYVMVDVFSAATGDAKQGAYATTSAARQWGRPATFNHVRLTAPPTYALTACHLQPEASSALGIDGTTKPWFFPTATAQPIVASTFDLFNPEAGYLYKPDGVVSPEPVETKFFSHPLPNGNTVCGPDLGWTDGHTYKESKFKLQADGFAAHSLPGGWTLLRSGPYVTTHSLFGSGQCGGCEIVNLDVFAVSPNGEIVQSLQLSQDTSGEGDQPTSAELYLAPDWSKLILVQQFDPDIQKDKKDLAQTYCLNGHVFAECGGPQQASRVSHQGYETLHWNDPNDPDTPQ